MRSNEIRYYQIRNGKAEKIRADRVNHENGRNPPVGAEIITLDGHRVVIYPENSVRPFPLATPNTTMPGQFGPKDLEILEGPYLARLFKKALALPEDGWTLKDIIMVSATCGSAGLSIAILVIVIKAFREANLL